MKFEYDPTTNKVKINGLEMEVWSKEECEYVDFVLCMRVADLPVPHVRTSVRERCSECDELVWFDSEHSPKIPRKLCMHCAIKQNPNE